MTDRAVSVIIPVYNLSGFLEESVASVIDQTVQPCEILIVDNCSTDDSLEIAQRLERQNPDLVRVLTEQRPGAPFARNTGLAAAKGQWIQFLDGDDLLLPEKIEHQLKFTDSDVGVVCGPVIERSEDGYEKVIALAPTALEGLFYGGGKLGFTSSNLWSRKALGAIDGWNDQLTSSQEYELMFRLLQKSYSAVLSDKALTIRRMHAGQISSTPYGPRLYRYLMLRHSMFVYLDQSNLLSSNSERAFLMHYITYYTRLRNFGPRLAIGFNKHQLKKLKKMPVFRRHPELERLIWKSHYQTILVRLKDVVKIRWKKYLLSEA